jgi:polysaccharide export outer membrane protein
MSKWVSCALCLLVLLTGVALITPAQTLKSSAKTIKHAETFGDSEYRLGAEDVVGVVVLKEEDLSVTAVVRPDGKITVPMIGEIVATNKTARELESEIQTKLTKFISNPQVNVVVREVNSPKVSVSGEVKKPDVYRIKQKTTVLAAIALAGGFTEFAKQDKVTVIRDGANGPEQFKLNLDSMLRGKNENIFYIQPGDTIWVH